jgi:holliday junction DNA helicase RuvA
MIESLAGTLLENEDDYAVLDVGGVRFRLEIPGSTATGLPAVGNAVTLLTRLNFNMNEGTFQLFGFATAAERDCFDIFRDVSGIGPRKGLMILSQIEIASFATAILSNDLVYLSKLKGVGKKTAERLVVELREKMVPYTATVPTGSKAIPGTTAPSRFPAHVRDAIDALIVLGCRPHVAERAISLAIEELGESASTENLVRAGLKLR